MNNNEINLWHYTSLDGLKGIISSKTLRASDYQFLNDSSELINSKSVLYKSLIKKTLDHVQGYFSTDSYVRNIVNVNANGSVEKFSEDFLSETLEEIIYRAILKPEPLKYTPCVLSFCKPSEDNFIINNGLLSQWRGYGREGGFAIIFNKNKLLENFENEGKKYKYATYGHGDAEYGSEIKNMSNKFQKHIDVLTSHILEIMDYVLHINNTIPSAGKKETLDNLCDFIVLSKHCGFKEEKEYRFYAFVYSKDEENIKILNKIENNGKIFKEINFFNRSGVLVPYINLFEWEGQSPIEAICIGPHKNQKLNERAIKTFLSSIGQEHIKLFCSEIPFIG